MSKYSEFVKDFPWKNLSIVAFSGFSGCGKSFVARRTQSLLQEQINTKMVSLSEAVKETASCVFGSGYVEALKELDGSGCIQNPSEEKEYQIIHDFWEEQKAAKALSYRRVMDIGQHLKKIYGEDIWANVLEREILEHLLSLKNDEKTAIVVPEIRFQQEMKKLRHFRELGANVLHFIVFRRSRMPEWCKYSLVPSDPVMKEIIRKDFRVPLYELEWASDKEYLFSGIIENDGDSYDSQIKEKICAGVLNSNDGKSV